jgi:hypothetical protein
MTHAAIGTLPVYSLAPLEYRYALDAAMSVIGNNDEILVRCAEPALLGELRNRIPVWQESGAADAGLWVEPQLDAWREDLKSLAECDSLVLVVSRPLARLIPEGWKAGSLGMRPGGVGRLIRALQNAGFVVDSQYGIHTLASIGLNFLSRFANVFGRPDLADRLGFSARLHYCTDGSLRSASTVALILAHRQR